MSFRFDRTNGVRDGLEQVQPDAFGRLARADQDFARDAMHFKFRVLVIVSHYIRIHMSTANGASGPRVHQLERDSREPVHQRTDRIRVDQTANLTVSWKRYLHLHVYMCIYAHRPAIAVKIIRVANAAFY